MLQVDPSTRPASGPPVPPEDRSGGLARTRLVRSARAFYHRHDRFAPVLFFFGGVTWDVTTLRRIDAWIDNVLLLGYLGLLGGLVMVTVLVESGQIRSAWSRRYRAWYPAGIQFFMGALFSAYLIYYSQSASLTSTSVFLLLLVGLLVANEFVHRRVVNLYLLFGLYFFAAFSFFVFFVPVLVKAMHYGTFLLGGVLSLGLVAGMLHYLKGRGVFDEDRQHRYALGLVVGLFGLLNLFYVMDWMPPVPMAMRYGGVFHHVERQGDAYVLRYEQPPWYAFWTDSDERFRYVEGDTVYCFAAIFAPTRLEKEISHVWSYYDPARRAWITTDRLTYRVVGGRDGGWRGYTFKQHVRPGRWRVDVRTAEGKTLGRVRFTLEPAATAPTSLVERTYR